jgi:hypothetical protein
VESLLPAKDGMTGCSVATTWSWWRRLPRGLRAASAYA